METALHDIIVIGVSAGGMEALSAILSKLPPVLPAAIFVVQHIAPTSTGNHYIAIMKMYLSILSIAKIYILITL